MYSWLAMCASVSRLLLFYLYISLVVDGIELLSSSSLLLSLIGVCGRSFIDLMCECS